MRLLVSTTIRKVTAKERSGYLYTVDLEHQEVIRRSCTIEPPYRSADANPRGGMRGSKGIAIRSDIVAITNTSSIFLYDRDWNLLHTITHPSCAGIHDIGFQKNSIWVATSRSDTINQFDFDGNLLNYIYFRESSYLRKKLKWYPPIRLTSEQIYQGEIDFRDPRTYEIETYDNAHVNSISCLDKGDLLVSIGLIQKNNFLILLRIKTWLKRKELWDSFYSLNRMIRRVFRRPKNMHSDLIFQPAKGSSAVLRISKDKEMRLLFSMDEKMVPSHSILHLSDKQSIYLDTSNGIVIEFNPVTGEILTSTKVTDGFLRGSVLVSESTLVMGSNSELIIFNLNEHSVQGRIQISDIPHESIFDIEVLPSSYDLPPRDFNEKMSNN
ncbi:MAG: hypothetical protein HOJ31_13235 [Anaerolineae bacterium]|jgi:hypothetical protein|nr:hypothetical protein [Anaerolineae bacterium]